MQFLARPNYIRFVHPLNHFCLPRIALGLLLVVSGWTVPLSADEAPRLVRVVPEAIRLGHSHDIARIIPVGSDSRRELDLTTSSELTTGNPQVAVVQRTAAGDGFLVVPQGNGETTLTVSYSDQRITVPVKVENFTSARPVRFDLDVEPILVANGCSTGPCHGKSRGQNGFQLSLLGFDPDFDFAQLTQQARGRRVFPASPRTSLLLLKGSAQLPHGGGERLAKDSPAYQTLLRWIEEGAPRATPNQPEIVKVTVFPERIVLRPKEKHRVIVTAHYSDGTTADVTGDSAFVSSESAVVAANATGLLTAGQLPGETAIMTRYLSSINTIHVLIPASNSIADDVYAALPRRNVIDDLVWQKLKATGITPSPVTDDATYLRRVHLDVIGRLPTPEEVKAFLASTDPAKREKVVDALLDRPEYADHWSTKWADLLRPNAYRVGMKAVLNYDAWIRESFRQNKPYDVFVRELITAKGSTWRNGNAVLYRDRRQPEEITTMVSQLFLGIRLECAKCHHHPFEKWGQEDFYSFAAYFARLSHKGPGISAPISGGEEVIFSAPSGTVLHPLTKKPLPPRPLYGEPAGEPSDSDPREDLAAWLTSPKNDYFAQVIANRVWADMTGRGIVEPVDDLRATNPPSNGPLLEALANYLRQEKFDLKKLIRLIATSTVYQLDSIPNSNNSGDSRNYSRSYRTRMRAEVVADAIADVTGVPTQFAAMPDGSRAAQLWSHRIESLTLDTFGRPDPNQDPPCERLADGAVTQSLHLMNSGQISSKILADESRANQLATSTLTEDQIVDELYLWCYSRLPLPDERLVAKGAFTRMGVSRRQATEDLMWALINTPEFLFRH